MQQCRAQKVSASPAVQRKAAPCCDDCAEGKQRANAPSAGWDFGAIPIFAQTKLEVGRTDDPLEHEADRVADRVMRMPESASGAGSSAERAERAPSASAIDGLRNGGRPLSEGARAFMEPRFAQDFGAVRVHDDPRAHALARSLSAQAFTVGRDIVFGAGRYAPETDRGRHVLAHELAHVVQQSNGAGGPIRRQTDGGTPSQADGGTPSPGGGGGPNAANDEGNNPPGDIEYTTQGPGPGAASSGAVPLGTGTPEVTLETGNTGASPINNLVHQQICADPTGGGGKQCFSFAATGFQGPQFSSTWLGWSSTVVGAIIQGSIYNPSAVPGATIVSRHTPTAAQASNWLTYMSGTRLGLQDGYSVARHNCRTFSQWEFRDAPSHW